MADLYEQSSYIPLQRRDEWEDRLMNSSRYRRCTRPTGRERPSGCEEWDDNFNTSDDPEVNKLRRKDQENYAIWLHEFANSLDVGVEQALNAFAKAGACMPCLGRTIYAYLRGEYLLFLFSLKPPGRKMHGFPPFLAKVLKVGGRRPKVRGQRSLNWVRAAQNFACMLFATELKNQCNGRPRYERLAVLLNHGKSCTSPLDGGYVEPIQFGAIRTEFTERLLRYRAWRGSFDHYTKTFLSLPLEEVHALSQFMKSRKK